MLGRIENFVGCALLDDFAIAHDDHPVTHTGHNAHIVRDQNNPCPGLTLEFIHQLQHLSLNGHVQRGRGFVGNQNLRATEHRNSDHDALAHAARQFMRELFHAARCFGDAHMLQPFYAAGIGLCALQPFVQGQDLAHLRADGHVRGETRQWVLKYHRHFSAANAA